MVQQYAYAYSIKEESESMNLPNLNHIPLSRNIVSKFGGINKTEEITENEFREMVNLTNENFPLISERYTRSTTNLDKGKILGMLGGDKLYVATRNYVTEITQNDLTDIHCTLANNEKQMVRIGSKIVIFPDGKVIDTTDNSVSKIEVTTLATGTVTFSLTNAYGETITYHDDAYYKTNQPQQNDYLLTEEDGVTILKQWSDSASSWLNISSSYMQITSDAIASAFKEGDGVRISMDFTGLTWEEGKEIFVNDDGNGVRSLVATIKHISDDGNSFTVPSIISSEFVCSPVRFSVKREMPEIAYVCEAQNRLWGCNKKGTEIYASKLGDPFNWNVFEGISTDSWAANIGSEGAFTGAFTYSGYPTFFKEKSIIKVLISSSGGHQTKETVCKGVADGCEKSLAIVNDILFFKSTNDICSYDGSYPSSVSDKLGNLRDFKNCVGGCFDNCFYIYGRNHLYVLDVKKGMWSEQTSGEITDMASFGTDLAMSYDEYLSFILTNRGVREDINGITWYAETSDIDFSTPDAKYISSVSFKVAMNTESTFRVLMKYDDQEEWTVGCDIRAKGHKIVNIPVKPRRCDSFRIRIEGNGYIRLHYIVKNIEEGSEFL